jgi:hypothetical protein
MPQYKFEAMDATGSEVKDAIGTHLNSAGALLLAAYRGRPSEARALISTSAADAIVHGEGIAFQTAHWATAILDNGLGRYGDALTAAEQAMKEVYGFSAWVLPELVEAAARSGNADRAEKALHRGGRHRRSGSDGRRDPSTLPRLVSDGHVAERCHAEAAQRLWP